MRTFTAQTIQGVNRSTLHFPFPSPQNQSPPKVHGMKGLSVLALPKDLCMNRQTDENGNKQEKDGLTLQKQTCQPMIKENWETHEKKKTGHSTKST